MEINLPLFQEFSLKISETPGGDADGKCEGVLRAMPAKHPHRTAPSRQFPENRYPTGRLQKGFLLLHQGQELAEEAVGFGVPVLKRGLQTIFPGAVSLTSLQKGSTWEVTAFFKLNLVEKISGVGNRTVENRLFYAAKNFLAAVIRGLPSLRGLLTTASSELRQIFHWETKYADAGFSATVKMIYTIQAETGKLTVEMDTSSLHPSITEVVVMNEQGAHHFDRYADASGASLQGEEIGCWDEVKAGEAWFESSAHQIVFRLGQVKGARLFRGRELLRPRLAWAGFGYSFPPTLQKMQYEMKIERLA